MNMKKKIFSLLLAVSLVLAMTSAGTGSVFAETDLQKGCVPTAGAEHTEYQTNTMHAMTAQANAATAVNINSGKTAPVYEAGPYSSAGWYVPVKIPAAGNFLINLATNGDCTVALYNSLEDITSGTNPIASGSLSASEETGALTAQIKKSGTYYLAFRASGYHSVTTRLQVYYAKAHKSGGSGAVTVKSGKLHYASVAGSSYRYFKITVPGTRNLSIKTLWGDGSEASKFKVKLYNATKKTNLLKGEVTLSADDRGFITYAGVPKGTYYVAVSTATDSLYGLTVTASKVSENSGSTKAKAKSLYKGNTKKGIITATQSRTSGDWYKFKISSSQPVSLYLTTKSGGYSGGLRFSIYQSGRSKPSLTLDRYYGDPKAEWQIYTLQNGNRLAPGTYYIKVQKYGSSSGSYSIKWK